MSPILIFLALLLATLTAGLPILPTSQIPAVQSLNSVALDNSSHVLVERSQATLSDGAANPPFDPNLSLVFGAFRSDGAMLGDVFRLTKCFCIDTPSLSLPAVYGQYYGSYYGMDFYNVHLGRSYAFNWTCASGELESLQTEFFGQAESYYLAPKCLAWMEEERKACRETDDGNKFCAEFKKGKDYYFWNGQKRRVHNHPAETGMKFVTPPVLNQECQRMCQTIPANTPGYMMDALPFDHAHKLNLAKATVCNPKANDGPPTAGICDWPGQPPKASKHPKVWETWNYIETYTDQADMCPECA